MLVEVPLTCGRCAYREEIRVFKDTIHRCGREDLPRDIDPMAQTPPAWCKIRPKAEPAIRFTDPDLAPVIAHLQAEAERSRSESARLASVSAARRCASRAAALERAAEILARHV